MLQKVNLYKDILPITELCVVYSYSNMTTKYCKDNINIFKDKVHETNLILSLI
jgi:hypothetical protein